MTELLRLIETLSFLSDLWGFRASRKNEGTCPSVLYVDHPMLLVKPVFHSFVFGSVVILVLNPSFPLLHSFQNFFKD